MLRRPRLEKVVHRVPKQLGQTVQISQGGEAFPQFVVSVGGPAYVDVLGHLVLGEPGFLAERPQVVLKGVQQCFSV